MKGDDNMTDPFSRLYARNCDPTPFENDHEPHVLCFVHPDTKTIPEMLSIYKISDIDIVHLSNTCDTLRVLKEAIQTGIWSPEIDDYKGFADELLLCGNLIWRSGRLIVPVTLRKQLIQSAHKSHATYSCTLSLLSENFWWPNMSTDIIQVISNCYFCKNYGSSRIWDYELDDSKGKNNLSVNNIETNSPTITTDNILRAQQRDNASRKLNITNIWRRFTYQEI